MKNRVIKLTESQLVNMIKKTVKKVIKENDGVGMEEPNELKEFALKAIDMFFMGSISSVIGKDAHLITLADSNYDCGDGTDIEVYYSFDVLKNYYMSFKLYGETHFDDNFTELDSISDFEFGVHGETGTYIEDYDGECIQKLLNGKFSGGGTLEDLLNEQSHESLMDCIAYLPKPRRRF